MSDEMMQALVLHAARDVRVEHRPVPVPGPDEVLLKIETAGICGSDALVYEKGPGALGGSTIGTSVVLGHEFAGRVVDVGAKVEELSVGTLVASGAGISCGECIPCRKGRTNLCIQYSTSGIQRDGGLAEFCAVPAATCEPVERHGINGDDAGLAQPMAIAHHSVQRGRPEAGERALIFGVGGIGMFATWVASQLGLEVTAIDLSVERLEIAHRLGAAETHVLDGGELPEALRECDPFDLIYEITGAAKPLEAAFSLARRGTRLVMTGAQKQNHELDTMGMLLEELEVIGSSAHVCRVDLPAALDLLAARPEGWGDCAPEVLPLDRVVPDGILPLAERRAGNVKTLVDPAVTETRGYRR